MRDATLVLVALFAVGRAIKRLPKHNPRLRDLAGANDSDAEEAVFNAVTGCIAEAAADSPDPSSFSRKNDTEPIKDRWNDSTPDGDSSVRISGAQRPPADRLVAAERPRMRRQRGGVARRKGFAVALRETVVTVLSRRNAPSQAGDLAGAGPFCH